MKRILFCAALLCAAFPAMADDMVLKGAIGEYRLTQAECKLPIALARVKPKFADQHRAGRLTLPGKTIELCWITDGETVWAMDEDGDIHAGPAAAFKPEHGA